MLPRLQAEERLRSISDWAVATCSIEADDRRQALSELEAVAEFTKAKPAKPTIAALEAMGIAVRDLSTPPESLEPASVGEGVNG